MNYVLGIDLGTSGVKCLLVSDNGNILGSASTSYKPDLAKTVMLNKTLLFGGKILKKLLKIFLINSLKLKEMFLH